MKVHIHIVSIQFNSVSMAGVFANDQYFDVVVEYAKRSSRDILCRLKIFNRATHDADITVLPQLWFRYVCNLAKCLPDKTLHASS